MDIYWIKDKQKCGPATVPDVVSMVQLGELTPETRGWHAGCENWMPLKDLPALIDFLAPRESVEEPEAEATEAAEPNAQQEPQTASPPVPMTVVMSDEDDIRLPEGVIKLYLPNAGCRLMARLVDMALYSALVYVVLFLFKVEFTPLAMPSSPAFWLLMIVLETLLLRSIGSTPGKLLFGIRVYAVSPMSTPTENHLSGKVAFWRSFHVFFSGLGMMMWFLPIVMGLVSLWMLKRRGITIWDARVGTLPMMRAKVTTGRYVLALLVLLLSFQTVSYCLAPWLEPMMRMVETESPEAARSLRNIMNELEKTPIQQAPAAPTAPAAPETPAAPTTTPSSGIKFLEL